MIGARFDIHTQPVYNEFYTEDVEASCLPNFFLAIAKKISNLANDCLNCNPCCDFLEKSDCLNPTQENYYRVSIDSFRNRPPDMSTSNIMRI